MSSTKQETQILLPAASVDFFLKDKATTEAARKLEDDWRFARVTISVEEGDVESAIASYKEATSPSLIIIESDTTDSSLTDRLGALAEHCAEGTNAIIIGPDNDVNLYRQLTSMGISDYLVRPVPMETLGEVIAKTLIEQIGVSGSKLVAVLGAKGGVGASSIAELMALGFSEEMGQKTILLDAAGAWSSLGIGLGFEPVSRTSDAVKFAANADLDSMKRMLIKVNDKLTVLATGTEPMLERIVEDEDYEVLIDLLMTSYPIVIVDLSSTRPSLKKTVLAKAHEILLVSTPSLPSLRSARTLMKEIKVLQGGAMEGVELVINMQGALPSAEVPPKDIKDVLGKEPAASLSYEPKIFMQAESEGKRVSEMKGADAILAKLKPFMRAIVKTSSKEDAEEGGEKGLLDGILSKLKK